MSAVMPTDQNPASTVWRISTSPGAASDLVEARPNAFLSWIGGKNGTEWASRGERPCFVMDLPGPAGLPAGWYEMTGHLVSIDGSALMPCLYPRYARGLDGDYQILLPAPGKGGLVKALILLKYDVTTLRFSPGRGSMEFRLHGFRLRRLARLRALGEMVLPMPDEKARLRGICTRGGTFLLDCMRSGISAATSSLFSGYRKRLCPRETDDYMDWVRRFDTLGDSMMLDLARRAERLGPDAPLISLLLPTYQTPERWLRKCIESVLAQVYPRWQLCIADDASPDPRVHEILMEYALSDSRIDVVRRERNGHISAASNSALELAKGEYVALLDHDDELRPHSLLETAQAIVDGDDVSLVYSDEDKIDADGRRFAPNFKPDLDPDLLRSQNYICHFTTIRTDLVRAVGGFREGFEGSQDHDLILRCIERLQPYQIRHVPKVLYHWRAIQGSTALSRAAKDYAASAGARAVAEHLDRLGTGARVEELSHGHFRVRWPLPELPPKVSLIVPTRDRVTLLRQCIDSILEKTRYSNYEIVVVDNGSAEPETLSYLAQVASNERVHVLRYDIPFNYSAINNWAVCQCDGELIGFVNNDIEVISPDWLQEMASHAVRDEVGAVGAMLYYPDDTIQHAGVILGVNGVAAHVYSGMPKGYPGSGWRARVAQSLSAVTGACLVVERKKFEQVGGLDEGLAVAFNDIDLCLRLREAGYRNVWTPFAELYHHESASRGHEDTPEKRTRFEGEVESMRKRWDESLRQDPAYNPNLSLESGLFALACPPRHGFELD
jgi:glycosyltransferase involved in cell wall biosynthesis